jgi:hypothetical protein
LLIRIVRGVEEKGGSANWETPQAAVGILDPPIFRQVESWRFRQLARNQSTRFPQFAM